MATTYGLSINGYPLSLVTTELQEWIDRYVPIEDSTHLLNTRALPGRPAQVTFPLTKRPRPRLKLGQLYWPARIDDFAEFLTFTSGNIGSLPTSGPVTLELKTTEDLEVSVEMFLLPARSISGGSLLSLVDQRYFLNLWSQAGEIDFDETTWADLYNDITTEMGITLATTSTIPSEYLAPEKDSDIWSRYENGVTMLQAVAANVGHRVIRGIDGLYRAVNAADAKALFVEFLENGGPIRSGGVALDINQLAMSQTLVPENYLVSFPNFCRKSGYSLPQENHLRHPVNGADEYTIEVAMSSVGATATMTGTTKAVHTTAKAVYSNCEVTSTPENESDLQALAEQLATDYFLAKTSGGVDRTYNGIVPFSPDGFWVDSVTWTYRADECCTRIISAPHNDAEFENYLHGTNTEAPLAKFVRFKLTESLEPGEGAEAVIQEYNPNTSQYEDGDEITVFDYTDELSGEEDDKGYARFWPDRCEYEVLGFDGSENLVPFYLTDSLTKGGSQTALIRVWTGGAWVASGTGIIVQDSSRIGPASAGFVGVAWKSKDSDRYEIITLEGDDVFTMIPFSLTDNLTKGDSQIAFIREWDGADWIVGTDEIEVFDSNELGPAEAEDVGTCYLNPDSNRHEIIALEGSDEFEMVPFYLDEDLERGGSANALIREWDGANWTPGATSIVVHDSNDQGPAKSQDIGTAYYNVDSLRYEILVIEEKNNFEIVPFYLNEDIDEGGSAEAQKLEWDGDSWEPDDEDPITVQDDFLNIGPARSTKRGVAYYDHDSERYEILNLDADRLFWAKAIAKWSNGTGNSSYVLCHKALDKEGTLDLNEDEEEQEITVYLPRTGFKDPAVFTDEVIGYEIDPNGLAICVTDYLDDKIGTVKMWLGAEGDVQKGWRIYDLASGRFPVGCTTSDPDIPATVPGTTGGEKEHTHDPWHTEYADVIVADHTGLETQHTSLYVEPHPEVQTAPAYLTIGPSEPIYGEIEVTLSGGTRDTSEVELEASLSGSTDSTSLTTQPGGGGTAMIEDGETGQNTTLGFQILDHENHWHQFSPTTAVQDYSSGTPRYGFSSSSQNTATAQSSGGEHLSHDVNDLKHVHDLEGVEVELEDHTHTINSHNHTLSSVTVIITPNPHKHTVNLDEIYGYGTATIPPHTHPIEPEGHIHDCPPLPHVITPNPHNHGIDDIEHEVEEHRHEIPSPPTELHIPPWFGINFIERFE